MEKVLQKLTLDFFGTGQHKITADAFFQQDNAVFLDVRSSEEAASLAIRMEHLPGILTNNIPVNEIPERVGELPDTGLIGVFCPANVRSAIVYAWLLGQGFTNVRIITGGYAAITEAVLPGKVRKALNSAA